MSTAFRAGRRVDCPDWCEGRHTDDEIEAGRVQHDRTIAEDMPGAVVLHRGVAEFAVIRLYSSESTTAAELELTSIQARAVSAWLLRAADILDYA